MNSNQDSWGTGQDHANPLVMIHRLLRGRYPLAIILGLIFGLAGGVAGYKLKEPKFRSTGVIRIQPSLPKVLYETEQSTAPKMFASFVNTQAQLITDGGVIERAIESDKWKSIREYFNDSPAVQIKSRLRVQSNPRAQELITVTFEDTNARVSSTIVNAVLDAYLEKYSKEGSIKIPEVVNILRTRKSDLLRERQTLDAQISTIAEKYRTENLAPLIKAAQDTMQQLLEQRKQLIDQRDLYKQFATQSGGEGDRELTPEIAASIDPKMADLVNQRTVLDDNRTELMVSEGLRAEHRDVKRITLMIDELQRQIDARMDELHKGGTGASLVDPSGQAVPSQEILAYRISRIDSQIKTATDNSQELLGASLRLEGLRADRTNTQNSLTEVSQRLDTIETESLVEDMKDISGKISIIARPTPGSSPTSDPRLKMAGAGFVGAGSLPVLALMLIGYASRKVQYSDDDILSGASAGIIGMLPDLGNSLDDRELASASAFAVHQIRSQLQIKNAQSDTRIYGVTSPAPGDGKTSMIIALGLSFAESGNRTLLVDMDFVGRGLSIHFGYPNAPSLAESLMDPAQLDALTRDTEFEGLRVLPAGFGDDERVSRLSPRTVGALMEHLKTKYDTVLIDSGPILGSVEASFVVPQADGTIMIVGRGQHKPLVKKAIDQVHALGGTIMAMIFNRALVQELRQSSSSMSVHFSRQMSRQKQEAHGGGRGVGPVAGALFSSRVQPTEGAKIKSADS